jgi:hypothetical protein
MKSTQPLNTQPETQAHPPAKSAKYLTLGKRVWGIVVVGATILAYVTLRPSIAVEPYASQDPSKPFAEKFYVQNNSIYGLQQLEPHCTPRNVRARNARGGHLYMHDLVLTDSHELVSDLPPGAKSTATCELMDMNEKYDALEITIWANFKIPLGIPRCKAFDFNGIQAADGTFIWTYQGSFGCG